MIGWNSAEGWQGELNAFEGAALVAVTAVVLFTLRRWQLKRRRRASLRRDGDGGYAWVELDGSPGRSRDDPRSRCRTPRS